MFQHSSQLEYCPVDVVPHEQTVDQIPGPVPGSTQYCILLILKNVLKFMDFTEF